MSESKIIFTLPIRSVTSFTFEINTITGINLNYGTKELLAFPNPLSEILNFEGIEKGITYSVYSISGKKLLEGSIPKLDVTKLKPGTYFLKTTENQSIKFLRK